MNIPFAISPKHDVFELQKHEPCACARLIYGFYDSVKKISMVQGIVIGGP